MLTVGIDATNLRRGGGRTHLLELLAHANPAQHGITKVVVWGARSTLRLLPERDWLLLINPDAQERGLMQRSLWQMCELPRQARVQRCHILFAPGGSHGGGFHPVVTMSQNLLPFQFGESLRYGFTFNTLRLLLLRWSQSNSFKNADGVIFLTDHASRHVQQTTGCLPGRTRVISHGVNLRFFQPPKPQHPISAYSDTQPFRLLYVSIVDLYKHQWHLVEALGRLRQKTGWPLALDLLGSFYSPALSRLRDTMRTWDPHGEWVYYHGEVPYNQLNSFYQRSDMGLFASSCENLPCIQLETMAAGLPVATSNLPPMSDILGHLGYCFDPENPSDIESVLLRLISEPGLRTSLAKECYSVAQQYSWTACADKTFSFLAEICRHLQVQPLLL